MIRLAEKCLSREPKKRLNMIQVGYNFGNSFFYIIYELWTNFDMSNSKEYVRDSARLNEKQSCVVFPNIHGQLDKCMSRF